jgi:hypothetical protein
MILHFSEIPDEHARTLKASYFDTWKGKISVEEPSAAALEVRLPFIYFQRMFWRGRYDLISDAEKTMFDFISRQVLEDEAGYNGMHGKEVLLGDVDHDLYAARIFGRLWKLYVDDPENGLKIERCFIHYGLGEDSIPA